MTNCQLLCISGLSLMRVPTPLTSGRRWHVCESDWPRAELWLAQFERLYELEQIAPTEILMYKLGHNATRVYSRMRVPEASQ